LTKKVSKKVKAGRSLPASPDFFEYLIEADFKPFKDILKKSGSPLHGPPE
jgi:hypothetical protein